MPEHLLKRSPIGAPSRALWDWHAREGAFERLNPPWDPVEVVERSGGIEKGARTVLRMHLGPIPQTWVALHTESETGKMFRDTQQSGPFTRWVHTHRFLDDGPGKSILEDDLEYVLPLAGLGRIVAGGFTGRTVARLFDYRHEVTRTDLERHARFIDRPRLDVAISGASGLVGTALTHFLTAGGHRVRPMRRGTAGDEIDFAALEGADAVVHLAGAGVADARWSPERKALLVRSRVDFTRALVNALGALRAPPKVLLSCSAIGVYGNRADEELTETSALGRGTVTGAGFLAQLCEDWEAEGRKAEKLGLRVVTPRLGIVLTSTGGALAKLLPPFRAGAGGPIAGGKQWMSWICLEDVLGALHHALFTESLRGPVNVVAPQPVTNAEFGKTLGRVLSRPAIAPLPAFALKAAFGEMAEGTMLASQRVLPRALEASGFTFLHPQLEQTLRFTLGETEAR